MEVLVVISYTVSFIICDREDAIRARFSRRNMHK